LFAFGGRVEDASDASLVGVHEGYHGGEDGADVPGGAPGFLVVVGEGGTDGLVDLEASVVGEELDFGWGEGVVLGQFEQAVVEASLELFLEVVEAEVEVVEVVPLHQYGGYGFFFERFRFLVDAALGYFFIHSC
jgi:hypothetical protein